LRRRSRIRAGGPLFRSSIVILFLRAGPPTVLAARREILNPALAHTMAARCSKSTGWFSVRVFLASIAVFTTPQHNPAQAEVALRENQHWNWSAAHANPLHCLLQQAGDKYQIALARDPREPGVVTIAIRRDGKPVCGWAGHAYSVFQIVGDRLYYADYTMDGTGGAIVAVDLANGKRLWREPLDALGPIEHSKYFNRMNLAADDSSVRITGNESAGRYIEVKDAATGRTIANRQLPPEANPGT
jgi:hypothetical protein